MVDAHSNTHLVALGILSVRRPELFPARNGMHPTISLDSSGNVDLRCDGNQQEAAWTEVKAAHRQAFKFLGGQSMIERKRVAPAQHRVALHVEETQQRSDNSEVSKRSRVTYAPDHDREVEG